MFPFIQPVVFSDALFYDVYTHLSELHLSNLGISVSWSDVDLDFLLDNATLVNDDTPSEDQSTQADRWGDTRIYFSQRFYRLPIGKMSI